MQLSFWISWQQLLVDVKWCQCNGSEMGGKPLMAVTLLNGLIYWSQVFRCDLRCSKPHHLTVVLRSSVRFLQSTQPRGIRTPSDHRFWWSFQKNRTTPPKKNGPKWTTSSYSDRPSEVPKQKRPLFHSEGQHRSFSTRPSCAWSWWEWGNGGFTMIYLPKSDGKHDE